MHVLRSKLEVMTHEQLTAWCADRLRDERLVAVEFANTQVVTMRRHLPRFEELERAFDVVVPDGMPLVWCLNAGGAGLRDRVYGPAFMAYCLEHAAPGSTHYLLGGSVECGDRLVARFAAANPGLRFVGRHHGRAFDDGRLEDDDRVVRELQRLAPDYVWVGLGTPRQQAWIHRNKPRLRRGVLLSVGFAFDANAGLKPDAPAWMQRRGLTWLYRVASEPKRLGPRYLKWNSLFLYYLAHDGLRGEAVGRSP